MPLHFTGTWEQALLTTTTQIAAKQQQAQAQTGYLGRTALQKIVYFLQVVGVPMRYQFDIYHYGPYCDRITRDVELLIADDVLKDASENPEKYSNYQASTYCDELIDIYSSKIAHYQTMIETVVRLLLPLEPGHLELLATLDYLYRQLRAGGGTGPWRANVIERFVEVKKSKFDSHQISKAYDGMVNAGLFES